MFLIFSQQSDALSLKFDCVVTIVVYSYSWSSISFITQVVCVAIMDEFEAFTLQILGSGLKFEIMTTLIVKVKLE